MIKNYSILNDSRYIIRRSECQKNKSSAFWPFIYLFLQNVFKIIIRKVKRRILSRGIHETYGYKNLIPSSRKHFHQCDIFRKICPRTFVPPMSFCVTDGQTDAYLINYSTRSIRLLFIMIYRCSEIALCKSLSMFRILPITCEYGDIYSEE